MRLYMRLYITCIFTEITRQAGKRLDLAPSPNFVAMATRVGPTTFCMVLLNRPFPKTPW